jgi:hypothetical protein
MLQLLRFQSLRRRGGSKMAFTKTSNPVWYADDTYANIAALCAAENIFPEDVLFTMASATGGNIVIFVRRGSKA